MAEEPVGEAEEYGEDRVFALLRDPEQPDERLDELVAQARARPGTRRSS